MNIIIVSIRKLFQHFCSILGILVFLYFLYKFLHRIHAMLFRKGYNLF